MEGLISFFLDFIGFKGYKYYGFFILTTEKEVVLRRNKSYQQPRIFCTSKESLRREVSEESRPKKSGKTYYISGLRLRARGTAGK